MEENSENEAGEGCKSADYKKQLKPEVDSGKIKLFKEYLSPRCYFLSLRERIGIHFKDSPFLPSRKVTGEKKNCNSLSRK
jgi:hypothetical protein